MEGRRSWYVVRKHLLQDAANKTAKGAALTDILFIPETFSELRTVNSNKGAHQLMLFIGEIKAIETARYGHEITIKRLRYNIAADRPLAKVVLSDTAPPPGALPGSFDRYRRIP